MEAIFVTLLFNSYQHATCTAAHLIGSLSYFSLSQSELVCIWIAEGWYQVLTHGIIEKNVGGVALLLSLSLTHWCFSLVAGMIHGLAEFFVDLVCCRFRLGAYRPIEVSSDLMTPHEKIDSPAFDVRAKLLAAKISKIDCDEVTSFDFDFCWHILKMGVFFGTFVYLCKSVFFSKKQRP